MLFLWLATPAVVMLLGAVLTSVWHPTKNFIGLIQHLTAGIVLAALTIKVFREICRVAMSQSTPTIIFIIGIAFMYGVKLLPSASSGSLVPFG